MKKHYLLILAIVSLLMGVNILLPAQDNTTVPQVIIGIGGRFETQAPYFDYVNVASFNPNTKVYTIFDTIYTQSVQDILIVDHYAYVAAQDTIVKYDLNTWQRLAAVADSGMSKLGIDGDKLIVTKQFPVSRFFVEILDANTLALYSLIDNISGDCSGVVATSDSVYVAVNGGYQGSEGKLAVIDPNSWTLTHEINFGPVAVGIGSIFGYGGYIYSLNETPGGTVTLGSVTKFNTFTETFTNHVFNVIVGYGIGIQDTLLYAIFNNNVGAYNLNNDQISDTSIILNQGAFNHIFFLAAALDIVNNNFYINVGNYTAPGKGYEATIMGDSITSWNEGISANAIAIEYQTPVGVHSGTPATGSVDLAPNPVDTWLNVTFNSLKETQSMKISDITGRTIYSSDLKGNAKSFRINTSAFPQGVYFLSVRSGSGTITKKFIKL
jgi:hypothetical protein